MASHGFAFSFAPAYDHHHQQTVDLCSLQLGPFADHSIQQYSLDSTTASSTSPGGPMTADTSSSQQSFPATHSNQTGSFSFSSASSGSNAANGSKSTKMDLYGNNNEQPTLKLMNLCPESQTSSSSKGAISKRVNLVQKTSSPSSVTSQQPTSTNTTNQQQHSATTSGLLTTLNEEDEV